MIQSPPTVFRRDLEVEQDYRLARHKLGLILSSCGIKKACITSSPEQKRPNIFEATFVLAQPHERGNGADLSNVTFSTRQLSLAMQMMGYPEIKGNMRHGVHNYLQDILSKTHRALGHYKTALTDSFMIQAVIETVDLDEIEVPVRASPPYGVPLPPLLEQKPCLPLTVSL